MQIKIQPHQVVLGKLEKIRCYTGCLNTINYLVFNHGLYCSSCLSTFPDLNEDHFLNIDELSKVLVDMTQQYSQRIKGEVSQVNLIKGEMQNMKKDVKKVKDGLSYDLKTVKQKSLAQLDELYAECLKQNQNEPLQAFYEPDITATLILNESQLIIQNLNNLKITRNKENKIEYCLKQSRKHPQKINKKVTKQYKQLNTCITTAIGEVESIMKKFAEDIRQQPQN